MQQKFDSDNYNEANTVTLKIPLTLPYPVYTNGFERVNGEFEYEGEYFKLVKHKLEGDTLHIVCYKDTQSKRISTALQDFSKLSNDTTSPKSPLHSSGKLISDYDVTILGEITSGFAWMTSLPLTFHFFPLLDQTTPVFSPPPDQLT